MPARYSLVVKRSAAKEILALSPPHGRRVLDAIRGLEHDPRPRGCEKLTRQNAYRIRVGAYRVVYTIQDEVLVVEVVKVGHRREIYR